MTKEHLVLTPRLRLLADWVPQGASLADVGTDHGYLPVWLMLEGRLQAAIASDLRPGPLSRGRETALAYGVAQRMDFRLCAGLDGIQPQEVDCVCIAGMGGEKIAEILAAAPWTADGKHRLLLQPMTRAEELRRFLSENGYAIRRERLALDRGTLYPVLEAAAGQQALSPGQRYGGYCLAEDPLGGQYLIEQILRLQTAVAELHRAGPSGAARADGLRDILTALLEEWEVWRHANST